MQQAMPKTRLMLMSSKLRPSIPGLMPLVVLQLVSKALPNICEERFPGSEKKQDGPRHRNLSFPRCPVASENLAGIGGSFTFVFVFAVHIHVDALA